MKGGKRWRTCNLADARVATGRATDIAGQVLRGDVLDRVVGERKTSAGRVVVDAVNPELLESGVAEGQAGGGQEGKSGLHRGGSMSVSIIGWVQPSEIVSPY